MDRHRQWILALDQGTSSSRAGLIDTDGRIRAIAARTLPISYPQPGWVEQDPEQIWQTQLEAARAVLAEAGVAAGEIAAVGITNQRETTLVWERGTGRPIHPAIVWQCRRTADRCVLLREGGWEPRLREKTGLVPDPYFSGTKVAHILDAVPGARDAAERGELLFGTVDTFLTWRLTGGRLHVTDVSNASRTLLYDLRAGDWDDEILAELRVPRAMLPAVRSSSEVYGEIEPTHLGAALPLAGMAGDQQAALFGQACFLPGMAKNTYGTGCFLLAHTGAQPVPSRHGLLTTVAWRVGEETSYALEGSVFVAGAAVQWLRDELGLIASAAESEALAAPTSSVPPWKRSPTRPPTSSRRWLPTAALRCRPSGWMAAPAPTTSSCSARRTSSVSPSSAPPPRNRPPSAPLPSLRSRLASGPQQTPSLLTGAPTASSSLPSAPASAPTSATPGAGPSSGRGAGKRKSGHAIIG
jgi:glycerol kinase